MRAAGPRHNVASIRVANKRHWKRTIRPEVDWAVCDAATNVIANTQGKVVPVDEGDWRENSEYLVSYKYR